MIIPIPHHHARHDQAAGTTAGGHREAATAGAIVAAIIGAFVTVAVSLSPQLEGGDKTMVIGIELTVVGALVGFALGRAIGKQGKI